MDYTISVHNGSKVCLDHNRRVDKVVSKENHIDRNGHHENWIDMSLLEAYEKLFGASLDEYNEKNRTKHPERVQSIKQYLSGLYGKKDKAKNSKKPIYECIVQVGGKDAVPDEAISYEILRQFVDEWQDNNPNLFIVGCYLHDDEASRHLHISYVPYAECSRGMRIQPSLSRALSSMGYKDSSINDTAQMQWEKRERERLKRICEEHGLSICDAVGGRKHLDTEIYKLSQKREELQSECETTEEHLDLLKDIENKLATEDVKEVERLYSVEKSYKRLMKFVDELISILEAVYNRIPDGIKKRLNKMIDSFMDDKSNEATQR